MSQSGFKGTRSEDYAFTAETEADHVYESLPEWPFEPFAPIALAHIDHKHRWLREWNQISVVIDPPIDRLVSEPLVEDDLLSIFTLH